MYRAARSGPLLVVAGDAGAPPDWLGSALAAALGGVSVVLAVEEPPPSDSGDGQTAAFQPLAERIAATVAASGELEADADRVAVLGIGGAAASALTAAGTQPLVRRLVLLVPTTAPAAGFGGVPPTFLQSSPHSATRSVSRALEIDLREAGVAVRPAEYAGLPDAWARYPKLAPGSKRAVEDIVAFLRRGFGLDGTFSGVIPAWDLK